MYVKSVGGGALSTSFTTGISNFSLPLLTSQCITLDLFVDFLSIAAAVAAVVAAVVATTTTLSVLFVA
jgi:hypothetical protein